MDNAKRNDEDARFARLPKWAQRELKRLESSVDYYKAKLEVGPEGSDTFFDAGPETQQPLGEGVSVTFYTDPEQTASTYGKGAIQAHVVQRSSGRRLEIRASDGLVVRAVSSNMISVETSETW